MEDTALTGNASAGTTETQAQYIGPEHRIGGDDLRALIEHSLDQDSAEDIVSIGLAGKSSEADFMIVASGRSSRHVAALTEKLMDRLKSDHGILSRVEGKEAADWVLIDSGDVIVHIFRPEVREFYQIEKMWLTAPEATARAAIGSG